MITIYHNPRCSKSREALTVVQQFAEMHALPLSIIDYQKTPLTLGQLATLHQQLGCPTREMVRDSEEEYAMLNAGNALDEANDAALLVAIVQHPKLLQRPIVVYRNRAVIGRPPERLHSLLQQVTQD